MLPLLGNLASKTIKDTMNPFDDNLDPSTLYNIGTGKAAKLETSAFLLNIFKIGEKARDEFIDECSTDKRRFEKPIL